MSVNKRSLCCLQKVVSLADINPKTHKQAFVDQIGMLHFRLVKHLFQQNVLKLS